MCGKVSLNDVEQRVDFETEPLERLPTDGHISRSSMSKGWTGSKR